MKTKTPGILRLKTSMYPSDHVSSERRSGLSAKGEDLASAKRPVTSCEAGSRKVWDKSHELLKENDQLDHKGWRAPEALPQSKKDPVVFIQQFSQKLLDVIKAGMS